jgi:polyisoprenoid-binding protein YceI
MKIIFTFALLSFQITAFASTWVINKDHSEMMFQVPYLTVSELTGRFNSFEGSALYTDDLKKIQEVSLRIQTSSIDTGNKLRDGHLKGADFFESQTYPEMIFNSTSVSMVRPGVYKAQGNLTIKKVTKPVTMEFTTTETVKDTWGYENKFVKFRSVMSRKDFNINWNKTLDDQKYLVGDVVTFWGVFQIQPKEAKTPQSKHMIPDTEYIREREKLNRETPKKEEESGVSQKFRKMMFWN